MRTYIGYAIWAFVQQFLMMDFFLLRMLRVLRRPAYAVLATAGIFTLAHLPNPVLTPLTLLWGLIGCWHFLRYRNLYPLALAHAILGITLAVTLPGYITHNMRVGLGYLVYRRPVATHRKHTGHMASKLRGSEPQTDWVYSTQSQVFKGQPCLLRNALGRSSFACL